MSLESDRAGSVWPKHLGSHLADTARMPTVRTESVGGLSAEGSVEQRSGACIWVTVSPPLKAAFTSF